MGPKPVPGDGEPVLGQVDDVAGLYVAFTHSGATLALIVGELLAYEILRGAAHPLLADFSARRFRERTPLLLDQPSRPAHGLLDARIAGVGDRPAAADVDRQLAADCDLTWPLPEMSAVAFSVASSAPHTGRNRTPGCLARRPTRRCSTAPDPLMSTRNV